eukprot:2344049-Amphidinium_carterae.1
MSAPDVSAQSCRHGRTPQSWVLSRSSIFQPSIAAPPCGASFRSWLLGLRRVDCVCSVSPRLWHCGLRT